jgi:hypothetical protein
LVSEEEYSRKLFKMRAIGVLFIFLSNLCIAQEKPSGRFVEFSKAAKGSDGKVQIQAATFLGGPASESMSEVAFLPDGNILVVGKFNVHGAPVLGQDADEVKEGEMPTVFIRLSGDLQNIQGMSRMGSGVGSLNQVIVGKQGIYISGQAGEKYESFLGMAKSHNSVKNQATDARTLRTSHRFLAKLDLTLTNLEWLVTFEHRRIDFGLQNGDISLVQDHREFWKVQPDGSVNPGPSLPDSIKWREKVPLVTDPRDGSFYIGGEYHSPTGLEPWRCPLLHKFDKDGTPIWTAWNWTGPIVGTDRFRLVSDSAVRQLVISNSGDLLVGGWSDGGNSCFLHQPYDLTKRRPGSKFGDSTWGAGVLSVAHLMRLDSQTMHLHGGCTWLTYHPFENKPNSTRIQDLGQLADDRVVFTGSATFGLIETPDAWVESWYTAFQRNPEEAKIKGGSFLGILSPDFNELLFSSVIPGIRDQRLKVKGNQILIAGKAKETEESYGINLKTFVHNPLQANYGGGDSDGYIMLINAGK